MADEITASALADLSTIAVQEAQLAATSLCDLSRYVTTNRIVPAGSISARFPIYSTPTATTLTDGNSLSNAAISLASATLTPTVKGIQFAITDLAMHAAPQEVADLARQAAAALISQKNKAIIALFDGFSQAVGTTNVDITEANIIAAVKNLTTAGAPGPYYLVIGPQQWADLQGIYKGSTSVFASMVREVAYKGVPSGGDTGLDLFGARVLVCGDFTSDGNGDIKGAVLSPAALGYAQSWDMVAKAQRDESLVGMKLVFSSAYAVGELKDEWGTEFLLDN
jgi:hypothetical protein